MHGIRRLPPVAVALAVVAITACAPAPAPVRLTESDVARLRAEPEIRLVGYAPEAIQVTTRGGDTARRDFGLVGLAAGSAVDQNIRSKLMAEPDFRDPALAVRDKLAAGLAAELGLRNLRPTPEPAPSDSPEELKRRFGSGLVLDVKTIAWELKYDANVADAYRLLYAGRARLVRLDGPSVVWQATCERPVGQFASTRADALRADGGRVLKQRNAELADWCVRTLLDEFRRR